MELRKRYKITLSFLNTRWEVLLFLGVVALLSRSACLPCGLTLSHGLLASPASGRGGRGCTECILACSPRARANVPRAAEEGFLLGQQILHLRLLGAGNPCSSQAVQDTQAYSRGPSRESVNPPPRLLLLPGEMRVGKVGGVTEK